MSNLKEESDIIDTAAQGAGIITSDSFHKHKDDEVLSGAIMAEGTNVSVVPPQLLSARRVASQSFWE